MAALSLEERIKEVNLVSNYGDDKIKKMGLVLSGEIKADITSRQGWVKQNKQWLKLASQVVEDKNFPWPKAANIKFPLLTTAAINFHARAYPTLLGNRDFVKTKIIESSGKDIIARGNRVSKFMSFQLLDQMEEWQEDMDRLLVLLPIIGQCYKKTQYDSIRKKPLSELVSPLDVIVNYNAESFKEARLTHRLRLKRNEILSYQRAGLWAELDLGTPSKYEEGDEDTKEVRDKLHGLTDTSYEDQSTMPYTFYESHCWYDLDEDGYEEPLIATLNPDGKVVRIVSRYSEDGIIKGDNNQLILIDPDNYFTSYMFIPDPNSAVHGLGFGILQGPTALAVDDIINQLLDAATLSNLGGGFIGKGFRAKGGVMRFRPGEWKNIPTSGDDIRKNIYPLPVPQPSQVMMELLVFLIQAAKDLTSVQDIFLGKNPGQNQPFKTTQEVVEQGSKVFNGIYKRLYRALTKELRLVYRMNSLYANENEEYYQKILNDTEVVMSADFEMDSKDILPSAEPDMIEQLKKKDKAVKLLQYKEVMGLNSEEVNKRVMEAEEFEDPKALMEPNPPAPPPPEVQLQMEEFAHKKEIETRRLALDEFLGQFEALKDKAAAQEKMGKITDSEHAKIVEEQKLAIEKYNSVTERYAAIEKSISDKKKAEKPPNVNSGS